MKTAKIFRSGNNKAVRCTKEGARWKNIKACAGRFKGVLERKQSRTFDERRP
jgi:hypothetical protein